MLSLTDAAINERVHAFFKTYQEQFGVEISIESASSIVEAELQKKQIDYVLKYLTDVDEKTLVKTLTLLKAYKKPPVDKAKPPGAKSEAKKPKKKGKKKVSRKAKQFDDKAPIL